MPDKLDLEREAAADEIGGTKRMEEKGAVARRMLLSAGATAMAMWLLLYAPTPYVVYEPGIAVPVRQHVQLEYEKADDVPKQNPGNGTPGEQGATGMFMLTAVRLTGPNLWGIVKAGLDRDRDVRLKSEVFGGQSRKQYVERINTVMTGSQETALQAAYRFSDVPFHIVEGKTVPDDKEKAIEIRAKDIGGPSAGLVFALQTIDLLTDGDLSRGMRIAATGTIDAQGAVGPIGGVKQKTVTVSQEGADLFIVPKGNEEQAKKTAKRLQSDTVIIGVDTIEEAVQAIDGYAASKLRDHRG